MPLLPGTATAKCSDYDEDQHYNTGERQSREEHAPFEAEYVESWNLGTASARETPLTYMI